MAIENHGPKRRNALGWVAVAFVFFGFVMLGAVSLLQEGGIATMLASDPVAVRKALVVMGVSLILATAVTAFSKRNTPVTPRTVGNYLLANALGIALFALAVWSYDTLAGEVWLGAMDVSRRAALILGLALMGLAILSLTIFAIAHMRTGLLTAEQTADVREQGRVAVYSGIWIAVMGLTLALLSLAGPGGAVSPTIALTGSIVLLGIATGMTLLIWPLLDELSQAVSRESGNAGFYLVLVIGGGWALLAHLGFAAAPAPLDWLTLLIVITFAASILAIARRGLLRQP